MFFFRMIVSILVCEKIWQNINKCVLDFIMVGPCEPSCRLAFLIAISSMNTSLILDFQFSAPKSTLAEFFGVQKQM